MKYKFDLIIFAEPCKLPQLNVEKIHTLQTSIYMAYQIFTLE